MFVCACVCVFACKLIVKMSCLRVLSRWGSIVKTTRWRRPIGYLICIGHFSQKSPIVSGFFSKRHLQLKASYAFLPSCILGAWIDIYYFDYDVCAPHNAYMKEYAFIHILF